MRKKSKTKDKDKDSLFFLSLPIMKVSVTAMRLVLRGRKRVGVREIHLKKSK